ncbi:alpha-1,6-mannosyl-glycoprotein 4-beta-N-acetylglucosaminyltransferase-like [Dendronephthya gigantea]|uniref:alpha-1,6-mannosyl-glycoprotein 4-beta-N-acetylglucosaminyltransferase-like n=1 Tax=Dendronephthya gigantea TaxID=151771 RepID=UPI00106CC1D7|nr:alpha-1,6-mannosyl-glycoprotein 4-beta-N-acetylglucosaminyltransferase-like [Dendronephthya gigantea]
MIRKIPCKIGHTILLAVLLSFVNTVIILIYLGPLNYKNDAGDTLPPAFKPLVKVVTQPRTQEIQQVSVVNQEENRKIDFPTVERAPGNNSGNADSVDVFTEWAKKFSPIEKEEDNLDHASDRLKFNPNVMSMVGRPPSKPVDIVIGIPTVKRDTTDYISSTLRHLVKYLDQNETKRCHIVVFSANFEQLANTQTANFIKKEFAKEVAAGLIEVIKPDLSFYPKLTDLPILWKDKPDRIKWRSKQCIDYALLFAYCRYLGHYYLQLEDDVSVSQTYFREMKSFIRVRGPSKWSNLQFGTSGFIGMLFKASDLGRLALFVKMYYWIFPVDILFRHFNDVHLYGNSPRDIYRPSLFKHLGRESSLKGQTRKIEGGLKKVRVNERRYTDSTNPSAFISTNIQVFESNTVDGPYRLRDLGYFWGKAPRLNDFIIVEFMKDVTLLRVVVESGSQFAPNDIIEEGELSTSKMSRNGKCEENAYKLLPSKTSKGKVDSGATKIANVKCVKLIISKLSTDKSRWLIIRELAVWSVRK